MIDIQKYIEETLKDIGVPVSYVARKEYAPPLVVFNFSEIPAIFWEDDEAVTKYTISINIFSKGNFITLKNVILKKMKQAGFIKDEIPVAIYLEDIGVYNQPMFFSFVQDVDDEQENKDENKGENE